MKHRIKLLVRDLYARVLYYTGLHRLVDRLAPRRLTILAGHCVADARFNGGLPPDMKIEASKLRVVLGVLGRRYELCTIGEGVRALDAGGKGSMVALSMDDGYRDNSETLLPLLSEVGAKATFFLEARTFSERRLNWLHKYFWLVEAMDEETLGRRYIERSGDPAIQEKLRRILEDGGNLLYLIKRALKYDAPLEDRERVLDELFREKGGDERALCDALYMDWDAARRLQASGMELGGHTVHHPVLSSLEPSEVRHEVEHGRELLERELGREVSFSFAYPFGRAWDYDQPSVEAVRAAGFRAAVTTHSGTNTVESDRFRLKRWMIDDQTPLHWIAAEACGGFELLRRFGLDLSQ